MRPTVNLLDKLYAAARSLAELVRRGLKLASRINTKKAFPTFTVPADAKPITLEQTLRAEDEL
jgi:hypothetical protein